LIDVEMAKIKAGAITPQHISASATSIKPESMSRCCMIRHPSSASRPMRLASRAVKIQAGAAVKTEAGDGVKTEAGDGA
jgi:hypothetical protein